MDHTDTVLDLGVNTTIYEESSPYTPPPRIRTPKEPEEKDYKSPRAVYYNTWWLFLGALIICTSVFYLISGVTQLMVLNMEGFSSFGICIICFLLYHCLEAATLVPNISKYRGVLNFDTQRY